MSNRFEARKRAILAQLDAPEAEYHDLSPKGSVDAPIRALIGGINGIQGLVTTSSCSGRISVFLEGPKSGATNSESHEESPAGSGGKGGGSWLFIDHDPVSYSGEHSAPQYSSIFGLQQCEVRGIPDVSCRYIHLKFEPMILHILTASLEDSQKVLVAAFNSGFRESGAVSLRPSKCGEVSPMVAVRSTGYSFDAIIGYQDQEGNNVALVNETYLRTLVNIANERFKVNAERIARFQASLQEQYNPKVAVRTDWEDSETRKARKREEGLARQQALQSER